MSLLDDLRKQLRTDTVGKPTPEQRQASNEAAAKWLRNTKPEYDATLATWNDLEWCQDALLAVRNVQLTLRSWTKEDSAEWAAYCIGTALTTLDSILSKVDLDLIALYEEQQRIHFQNIQDAPEAEAEAD